MATYSNILPGESHGQKSLAGYSPWGCKELDTTERLNSNDSKKLWELQQTEMESEGEII